MSEKKNSEQQASTTSNTQDAEQRKADAIKLINKQRAEEKTPIKSAKKTKPVSTKNTATSPHKAKISKVALLALTVALLSGASIGGLYYWQQQQVNNLSQQFNQQLKQQSQQQLIATQNKIKALLSNQQQQINTQIKTAINQLDASQQKQVSQLETKLAKIAQRKPSDWLVNESQYLIRVALRSLWLEHNTPSAISLLKEADQRLKSLNNPKYLPVRQAINQDIAALQLLPKLTTDDTILSLMGLAQQINKLPLIKIKGIKDNTKNSFQLSENATDWKENLARSWHKFIDDFITIRRQDNTVIPLMSPQYQQNLRENLSSKLQLAQWAASQGKTKLYQQALNDIAHWHRQYFAMNNPININFSQEIKKLKQAVIAITLPKTFTSLTIIEQLINAQELNLPSKMATVPSEVKHTINQKKQEQSLDTEKTIKVKKSTLNKNKTTDKPTIKNNDLTNQKNEAL